ncbi:MAG: DUF2934 domain-containing protein [Chitinispirillaceae bacterium]|nr:DUF2934 domain-containing protein [Chitinispirillaceae bacterium]
MESVQDRIAKKAYDLFVARGGQHGYHIEDWLKAEKEILAEQKKPASKKNSAPVKPAAKKTAAGTATKKTAAPKKK